MLSIAVLSALHQQLVRQWTVTGMTRKSKCSLSDYKPCRNLCGLWLYPLVQVCKNEKDDDSATRRKEMELAEEEDFGNNLVQRVWMIYRGPGFLPVVWFCSSLTLSPPLPSVRSSGDTQEELRKRDNLLMGEEGRGWARSRIIRLKEILVIYKSFKTLCSLCFNSTVGGQFSAVQYHEARWRVH